MTQDQLLEQFDHFVDSHHGIYKGKVWHVWENEGIYLFPAEIGELIDWDQFRLGQLPILNTP